MESIFKQILLSNYFPILTLERFVNTIQCDFEEQRNK